MRYKIQCINALYTQDLAYVGITGGGQKKVATHNKWITWFIMAINEENVNKSYVFVLA